MAEIRLDTPVQFLPKVGERRAKQLEKLGVENPANFFEHPSNYCGLAAVKSKRLAQKYRELCK